MFKALTELLDALKEDTPGWDDPDLVDNAVSSSYIGEGMHEDDKLTYGMIARASAELDQIRKSSDGLSEESVSSEIKYIPITDLTKEEVKEALAKILKRVVGGKLMEHITAPWATTTFKGSEHRLFFGVNSVIPAEMIANIEETEILIPNWLCADVSVAITEKVIEVGSLVVVKVLLLMR